MERETGVGERNRDWRNREIERLEWEREREKDRKRGRV